MPLGDFARLNDYDPFATFPAGADEDEARWARERAAERLAVTHRAQGSGAERGERVMGGIADLTRAVLDPVVTELTDYSRGRVAPAGPMTEEEAFRINQRDPGRATWEMLKATIPFRNPLGAVSQFEARGGQLFANAGSKGRPYPVAPRSEWYGDANYANTGGRIETMSPDEFLARSRPMKVDDVARENIDDLKAHIEAGRTLDPLALYKSGKEDGRHRAYAAKELGINEVPVLMWGERSPLPGTGKRTRGPTGFDPVGWQGPVGDIAEAGAIPRGTHANWYIRHDPKGGATLSNESGPSGNVYGVNLKGGPTPNELQALVTGAPVTLGGKRFDLRNLRDQNAEFVFGPTDKMAGGDWLQLPGASIRQEAGINFPFIHERTPIPGVPYDAAPLYASVDTAAANKVNAVAESVIKRGGVPYYVPLIMGPGAGDSTKQMAFTTLAQLRHAEPNSAAVKALDAAVRAKGKGAAGYPGFNSPLLDDWLTNGGLGARRAFVEGAAARSASDRTGVDVSVGRFLNTDPRLAHTPSGSGGIVMGRMRPDVPVSDYPLHSNYGATFFGQRGEIGGLGGNMPFSQLAPDMHRGLLRYTSPGGGLFADTPAIQVMRGLAKDVPQTQKVTDEVVKNWLRWFERNPQGWAIPGAIGLGAYADQSSYR